MPKLVLLRHGQSTWNRQDRFTGWEDVDLTAQGYQEAKSAGQALKNMDYRFDIAYSSVLKRAKLTLWQIMGELDQTHLPVKADWRLNERHYGALQGLQKKETSEKHGVEQVQKWRRGFTVRPPAIDEKSPRHPKHDPRYMMLSNPPAAESLADTFDRVVPFWQEQILPDLKAGKRPIVVAHGNSLRVLRKHLENISNDKIAELDIPTGLPIVYEFDADFKVSQQYDLGDKNIMDTAVGQQSSTA
ncbi:2,3-diphosphoglycerate-dependent phosphoglycerate mutase [Pseudomonadota bacterium]